MEEFFSDIDEAARIWPEAERVFLENGDAFCLSAERLKQIAEAIHERNPGRRITLKEFFFRKTHFGELMLGNYIC